MGRNKGRNKAIFAICAIACVSALIFGWPYIFPESSSELDDTTGVYSLVQTDYVRGIELSDADATYTLYGTDDPSDFLDFTIIDTGDDLDDITNAKLLDEVDTHDYFILRANLTHSDEDAYDDELDHSYYERWFMIFPNRQNTLEFAETPSAMAISIIYQETGLPFTDYASDGFNLTNSANLSFVIAGNLSQSGAVYLSSFDYETQEYDCVRIVCEFNTTAVKTDFGISGCGEERDGTDALAYSIPTNNPIYTSSSYTFNGYWDADATTELDNVLLYFDGTLLANCSAY